MVVVQATVIRLGGHVNCVGYHSFFFSCPRVQPHVFNTGSDSPYYRTPGGPKTYGCPGLLCCYLQDYIAFDEIIKWIVSLSIISKTSEKYEYVKTINAYIIFATFPDEES